MLDSDKTKALVVSRSRTVNPPHGDLVLSVVTIRDSPNLDIVGVGELVMLVKPIFVGNSVLLRCYFAFLLQILEYCSPV